METEDQSGGYQAPAEFPGTPPNTPVIRCLECGNPFPAQAQFCGVCGRKLTVPPEQDSGTKLSSSLLPGSPADTPPQVPPVSRRTATVFLSYSHQDRDFVLQLHRDLQAQGIHVWIDHESIQLGTPDWEVAVRRAIREADAIVLAASPDARQSRIVKDELNVADMYRRPIYPIWVTGEQWMESIPLGWGYIQHIDARGTAYTSGVQQLAKVLLALPARRSGLLAGHSGDLELLFEPRNPYKGLSAFSTWDAQDFFGREQLIQEVIQDCTSLLPPEQPGNGNPRLMALIGPSGSGKSSLVMAGILPHFQAGGLPGSKQWIYLKPLRPGSSPLPALAELFFALLPARDYRSILTELEGEDARGLHRLAAALTVHPDTKVVLFVDQFEELFTQVKDEKERQRFINLLLTAATEPHGPLIVFLALRADFYRPVQYPELARLIQNHYRPVPLMKLKDLRSVIEKPAMLPDVQVQFQGDLVGDMLFEVQGQVGSLPLLQFTLEQLFQRRHDRLLTEQAYREIGGVKGALSRRAEEIYQKLPSDEHRQIARDIFLRLFVPGSPELDATRRRAARSELKQADPGQEQLVQQTLETFISARFLTTNQVGGTTTVEVSHEALSREWKRLTEWLHEGQLTVSNSIISNNSAHATIGNGGGIFNEGTAAVTNSTFSNNVVSNVATTSINDASQGGGIFNSGKLTVTNSIFSNNKVFSSSGTSRGGGISNYPTGILMVTSSTFSENTAQSATNNSQGGGIDNAGKLTVTNSTFSNNKAVSSSGMSFGGGISNNNKGTIMVSSSTFSENVAQSATNNSQGGGIDNEGKLTVKDTTFSSNQVISGSRYAFGGGINNYNTGTTIVSGSTFSGNIVKSDKQFTLGGGVYNEGKLTIINSTLLNNQAISGVKSFGGGILSRGIKGSSAIIRFCTIYENSSNEGGGIWGVSNLTISSSIIAHNNADGAPDIFGAVISEGYNLIENVIGVEGLNIRIDRQVKLADLKIESTLGNHGGPTQTLALLQGSQAIDVLPQQACSVTITDAFGHTMVITTDQRGDPRPDASENACDVGAYESSY